MVREASALLDELRVRAEACRACSLAEERTRVVFGEGDPRARMMIVGEAPGKNEDAQGAPFVGKAGQNLNALLEIAGLERGDVFIANVLKCRPPKNRDPRVGEIEACAPFLREQMRLVAPDVVVTLGNFATRFILETKAGITELRGTAYDAGGFKVFPVYHPAAAIYDRKKQSVLEDDFAALGKLLERMAACKGD